MSIATGRLTVDVKEQVCPVVDPIGHYTIHVKGGT